MISAIQHRIRCGSYCGYLRAPKASHLQPSPTSSPIKWWFLSLYLILLNYNCYSVSATTNFPDSAQVSNFTSPFYIAEPALTYNLDRLQLIKLSVQLNKLSHIRYGNHNLRIFSWNLGSSELWKKIPVIESFIAVNHPNVIGFPEANCIKIEET